MEVMCAAFNTPPVSNLDQQPARPPDEVRGTLERITFHNEDNGYTVARLLPEGARDVVTITGNFTGPVVGEMLVCYGIWTRHPQWGRQMQVQRYETVRPATAHAIEKYLGSGMVKGVGPVTAKRIVAKFGEDALDIIEKTPRKLLQVQGIGEKMLKTIKDAWKEQSEIRNIMLFLQGHGISPAYAIKIYKTYQERSISIVEKNPYQLATDIWGIGFKSADKIARNLGFAEDDPRRLEAGVVYVLNESVDTGGNAYLTREELVKASAEILGPFEITDALNDLTGAGRLVLEESSLLGTTETAIYTPSLYNTERSLAQRLKDFVARPVKVALDTPRAQEWLAQTLEKNDLPLTDEQQGAVRMTLQSRVSVITGGPGVGKCVTGDTLVLTGRGMFPIGDLWCQTAEESVPDTFHEYALDIMGKTAEATSSHIYYGGAQPIITIGTQIGLRLGATPNHRIWAMTPDGPQWMRMDEITSGSYVAVRRGDNYFGDGTLAPDLGYLLGVISGDGMQTSPVATDITNNDMDLLERCQQIIRDHLGASAGIYKSRQTHVLRSGSRGLREKLTALGVSVCRSGEKSVPNSVLQAGRAAILEYLAGLIDTDGHVARRKTGQVYFEITLKSEQLIRQVQFILLNLGVVSRITEKFINYHYKDTVERRCYWRLGVSGQDADLLLSIVPTFKTIAAYDRIHNTNRDVVPLPGAMIRAVFTSNGTQPRRSWWAWKREINGQRLPSRQRLKRLLEAAETSSIGPQAAAMREAIRDCYYWDKVTETQPGFAPVYDLTVPAQESFVANAFINHNTHTTRAVVAAFKGRGKRVLLASPTGRAAKRLSEMTGAEASTIHRMLSFDPSKREFVYNADHRLECDVLLVDEASMLDMVLAHSLIKAVPDMAQVIFVGDVDQLPSVGPGNVLRDMIDSGIVPVTRLTQVFRQAAQSGIIKGAHAVNAGKMPILSSPKDPSADFVYIPAEEAEDVAEKIVAIVAKSLPKRGYAPGDIQVLSPMQRGSAGAAHLNQRLQEVLNPPGPDKAEVQRAGRLFRVGDRVIQLKNNYDKLVFNGDIGTVIDILHEDSALIVRFAETEVAYDFSEIDELTLARAVSIHKCIRAGQRVSTVDRGTIPIEELEVGEWIFTGDHQPRRVLDKVKTGRKPVVRIRTRNGYQIDVSPEHPLFVSDGTWPHYVLANDLTTCHYACISRSAIDPERPVPLPVLTEGLGRQTLRVPAVLDENLAWLLGVTIGDGSYRDRKDGTVDFTNQDETVLDAVRRIWESYGLRVCAYRHLQRTAMRLYIVSRAFREWLCRLGLDYVTANHKHMPPLIFRASASVKGAFLRGLFDTDGSASGNGNSCRLVTSSNRLAREVQQLLLSLGIVSGTTKLTEKAFCVRVSGTSLATFAGRVGFTVSYKQETLLSVLSCRQKTGKTNNDVIPFAATLVDEWKDCLRKHSNRALREQADTSVYSKGKIRKIMSQSVFENKGIAYQSVRDIKDYFEENGIPVPPSLCLMTTWNYFYDPIVSIERLDREEEMYDIEVEGIHSFVAEGFVCHNSQGSEFPVAVIALHTQHYALLQRNLVYTALTRAKKLAVLVGNMKALAMAVKNDKQAERHTRLKERLQGLI